MYEAATELVSGVLILMFLVAAYLRWKVHKLVPETQVAYPISAVCAIAYAVLLVIVLLEGDSEWRTLSSRVIAVVSTSVVWLWSPQMIIRIKRRQDALVQMVFDAQAENEVLRQQLNKVTPVPDQKD